MAEKKKSKTKKTVKSQARSLQRQLLVGLGGLCLIAAGVYLSFSGMLQPPETRLTEMKKIPSEVKRTIQYATPSATFRVPILMYHYVEIVQNKQDKIRVSLDTPPGVLASQIKTLQDGGYTFMTASQLADVLDGKAKLPEKPILLTFDDGHRDFYTDVLPILKQYHVKATNYVISGFLGGTDFMTAAQVKEVARSGLVEIGAHTVHHLALKGRFPQVLQYEVRDSKNTLERLIHQPVVSFAYPYGSFDLQAIQAVKDAGFRTAVSTIPGIEVNQQNRYFLYRIRPGYRTGQELLLFLQQTSYKAW